jgi:phosphoribosyl 1,2-cyclic phosphodiesterase
VRLSLLGSGSSGNVAFVEAEEGGATTRLLVDAGLGKAETESRLARIERGLGLHCIDGVLVTHDHNDHAGHARALGRPLWATAGTRRACSLEASLVRAGEAFTVGAFRVKPVLLPHDGEETVGYVLEAEGARVGILTDCGHDAPEVAEGFAGCDVLVLETNHDATMLKHGPYPPSLKRRVGGRLGHLSNDQAASLLKQMAKLAPLPRLVVAAHISQANNRGSLAKSALDRVLGRAYGRGLPGRVLVAAANRPTPVIRIENGTRAAGLRLLSQGAGGGGMNGEPSGR